MVAGGRGPRSTLAAGLPRQAPPPPAADLAVQPHRIHRLPNRMTALIASRTALAIAIAGAIPGAALAQSGVPAQPAPSGVPATARAPAGAAPAEVNETIAVNRLPPVPRQFGTARPASAATTPPAGSAQNPADRVLLEADSVEEEADTGVIVAIGNVVANNAGRTLRADRITYNRSTGEVIANGNVAVLEEDGTVSFADELRVDDELATGVIRGFAMRLPDNAVLAANTAVRRDEQRVVLSQMAYTACELCPDGTSEPTWTIRAREALQDQTAKTITYRDVVFDVAGVPVLWLPYFRHPDPTAERQSGFLQPTPGRSGRYGLNVEVPYLMVLDDHSDITIAPTLYQYINPLIGLDYRRAFHSGDLRLEGTMTYESFFRRLGKNFGEDTFRGSLFGQGLFAINDVWRWGFGIEHASDDTYTQRYDLDGAGGQRGLVRGQPSRMLSQLYITGQTGDFYARGLAINFQDLLGFASRKATPTVAPLVDFTRTWAFGPMGGRVDLFGSGQRLDRRDGQTDTVRASAGARWRGQTVMGPGLVVEPQLYARTDWFNYEGPGVPGGSQSFGRSVGYASVDVRWPLERVERYATWTLEPRLLVSVATEDNEAARIFNEDSVGAEFDATNLFRPNGASGFDIWDGGASVTAGVSFGARIGDANAVRLFLGSRWREERTFTGDRIGNLDRSQSDIVADVEANWGTTFQIAARSRFDSETGELVRAEVASQLNAGPLQLSARYHDLPQSADPTGTRVNRELAASATWKINDSWSIFVGGTRDLLAERNLREVAGVIWKDDCTEIRLLYDSTKTTNRFIEPNTSIRFEVAFRTLGVLNPDPLN